MESTTGRFKSFDGIEIFYRSWPAVGSERAVLLLVHGVSEHSARYEHVGRFLADKGVAVYAYDHRGHGRSGGRRGWLARFDDFLDDLGLFHRRVASEKPGLPLFLLGHSMGGLIVTAYLLERPCRPDYLVLSGPAIVPLLDPSDRTIDPTRLSRDPKVWEAYMEDPLVLRERVTDELFVRLGEGLALLPGRAHEIAVPILLLHGGEDRLCSAEGARLYVEGSSSADKTVKIYPGARHEVFNETNRDEVLADLWCWMEERLAGKPPSA